MSLTDSQVYDARWRKVRKAVLRRDNWECQIRSPDCEHRFEGDGCGREGDHIVPWRHGGALYDPANIRAACPTCNRSRQFRHRDRNPSREW